MGPSKLPLAWFELALPIAMRTSSSDRLYAASAFGLARIRMAGRWPPLMLTSPTPDTCDSLAASRVSARCWISGSGNVRDVSARVTIGVSAGLTLL